MEIKRKEFRGHFATPAQEPSRGGFGEGSGSIFGGFWDGFGGIQEDFWRILNEIWKVFECIFGGFLIGTCLLPGAPQATRWTHVANPRNRKARNPSAFYRIPANLRNTSES